MEAWDGYYIAWIGGDLGCITLVGFRCNTWKGKMEEIIRESLYALYYVTLDI